MSAVITSCHRPDLNVGFNRTGGAKIDFLYNSLLIGKVL